MKWFFCLFGVGLYLHMQSLVNGELSLSQSFIESAVQQAKQRVDADYEYARRVTVSRVRRRFPSSADILRLLKHPRGQTRTAVRAADYMDATLKIIKRSLYRQQKRSIDATDQISVQDLQTIADLTGCTPRHRVPSCQTVPSFNSFRTPTSACNNIKNTRWGSANIPFARWLPANYQDNIVLPKGWDPQRTINGHILPLVREVSNRILQTANEDIESDPLYTHMVTTFAQWTDHDLTFTPQTPVIRSFNGGIDCQTTCENSEPCFPIQIPPRDPRFGQNSSKCMPFSRSAPACGSGNTGYIFGNSTVRQQMNALTAYLDAGQVYGSDEAKANSLRDLSSELGLLRVNPLVSDNGRELLPFVKMGVNMCATKGRITNDSNAEEVPCFLAGDDRVDENIVLTSLHVLFVREHNRLARALAKLNPSWNGERLYQEARKIIGAYMQIITFRDFLPRIVGPDAMKNQLSTYPGYDEKVDPSIANVFSTAAFRFAHTMIQPFAFRLDEEYKEHPDYPSPLLHTAFFTPWRVIEEGGIDPIIRGLIGRQAKLNTQDHLMHDELRERLFQFTAHLALDLGSLNMQRGRDHGLPGYNAWRKFCGLSQPRNLQELSGVMKNPKLAKMLMDLYGTPDNIDVWLGGIAEPFVRGGRVGPLFACLIATQFQKIRRGDRLWWENHGVFTAAQRESLMNTSSSRIICDNTGITEVPETVFQYRPRGRGYTRCEDIPAFDLSPWKEVYENGDGQHGGQGPQGPQGPIGPPGPRGPPGPPGDSVKEAFAVRLGMNYPTAGLPIPFHEVIYNGQNSYDTTTGIFTSSHSGVYQFDFHCTIYQNNGNVDLMHNGKIIVHAFTTRVSGYIIASGTTLIELNEGDKVWLVANQGGTGQIRDSYFSGHYLFSTDDTY
ncbi:eosinophil peroxidase-like [Thalassophryne amazonica]|uniref:eosinophil peroxidase-like n=1 Tax=Thalassophryne amazonica TaxID=390379 RepID=UPI00147201B3|nr:eosinophil peroxidase-like [Thalassophryne amazonica]